MHNHQQKAQEAAASKPAQKVAENRQAIAYKCSNCGAAYSDSDKFCSECGMGLKGNSCAHCGAATQPNWEICAACGHNLLAELCSFCGGKMTPGDAFCPECGNPRTGIMCSGCSTLNFRSFCRKCNMPLNAMAQEAMEDARKDPKVQKAIAIAQELEELEQFLLAQEEAMPPEASKISAEDRELVNQYKDLLAAFRGQKPQEKVEEPIVETPNPAPAKPKSNFSINIASKEEAMEKYKKKLAEMQATLASMTPDAGMTPQMQKNYYSARKVEIISRTKTQVPLYWICNYADYKHPHPEDCYDPMQGGTWIYEEREEVSSTWEYQ